MSEKFMIIVTGNETIPEWVSDKTVWYNLKEFSLNGITGIVREKIEERGGFSSPETLIEIANRKSREHEFSVKGNRFIASEAG